MLWYPYKCKPTLSTPKFLDMCHDDCRNRDCHLFGLPNQHLYAEHFRFGVEDSIPRINRDQIPILYTSFYKFRSGFDVFDQRIGRLWCQERETMGIRTLFGG